MSDDIKKNMIPPPPPRPEGAAKAVEDVVKNAAEQNMPSAGQRQQVEAPVSQAPPPPPPAAPAPAAAAPPPAAPVPAPAAPAASPAPAAPAPAAPAPAAPAPAAPAPAAPAPAAPAPAPQASATMDKVTMPADLKSPDVGSPASMPPSAAPSASLASVEKEFFSGDAAPSLDMPKVSGPDVSFDGGSSMMADSPPKMRGGMMKILLPLLFLGAIAFAVFFFFFSGDGAPKSRPTLPSPNEGRVERPAPPIPDPVVEVPPTPTESIYVKQCREHFNASITARGENPAAYGDQADAYVANCATALEKQAAGGAQ